MEEAYTAAFYCEHGCACKHIDKQYHQLQSEIVDLEGEISVWEVEIANLTGLLVNMEQDPCDF